MARYTFFTHGTGVFAETAGGSNITSPGPLTSVSGVPWTDVLGLPQGFGKSYRGKSGNTVWFHAPILTPVHAVSQVTFLVDVWLNIDFGSSQLNSVHCWDGGANIARVDGLAVSGDQRGSFVDQRNKFPVRESNGAMHRMSLGLCVSMAIRFPTEATVRFDSVGASFMTQD